MRAGFYSVASIAIVLIATAADAAISYSTVGGTYAQDFDSLPNSPTNTSIQAAATNPRQWADDTVSTFDGNDATIDTVSIPGWYLWHTNSDPEGGANGHQRLRLSSGTSTTGSFYSFGTNATTNRALGMVNSNTFQAEGIESVYGLRLTNTTGQTLTSFTVEFNGEQWRKGGTGIAHSVTFDYSLNATAIQTGTYVDVPSLTFSSVVLTPTGSLDGNSNFAAKSGTVSNIAWAHNTDLWLRWSDLNESGSDDGLAIDDFEFSANVPEPTGLAVLGLVGAGLVSRRRR